MEILVISGLSGAGKSCAASCLEDIGYYTVDNMPAAIIPKFAEFSAESDGRYDRVALVNDIRGGVDSFHELLEVIDRLREGGTVCRLLYLEADTQSIIKRYKETRRRHPLMESGATIEDAVKRETELLRPLRERADFVIDTTQLSAAKLRGELYRLFAEKGQQSRMSINVVSFGYKYGMPLEADLVFDVRFMPNPYYVPELRYQTGMNDDVYNYVFSFPQTKEFLSKLEQMLAFLLPLYQEEGKAVLTFSHQNLVRHNARFPFGYTFGNAMTVRELMADHGVNLNLSGHIHIQHIGEFDGLHEVTTSALSIAENHIGVVEIDPERNASYQIRELEVAGYARQAGLSDPNLLDFGTYSRDYFRENSMRTMGEKLDAMGVSEADRELMLEAAGEFNLRYFTGRTVDYQEELAALPGYALWNELPDGMGDYFAFILDSEKKDETRGDFGSLWLKGENT